VRVAGDPGAPALARLGAALARRGLALERTADAGRAAIVFERGSVPGGAEAYRLDVGVERAAARGAPPGLAHAASTLAQLVDLPGRAGGSPAS